MAIDYGTDIDCGADLSVSMGEVSGWRMLAQACLHRLITPRGALFYDPDYGYDLRAFIGSSRTPTAGEIENELLKDERLADVEARVFASDDGATISIYITVTAHELGTFQFTLEVSAVTAELLLEEAA